MFTIILFFLAVSVAFAMIARKIWQLRTGRVTPGYEEADWHDISIEGIRLRLIEIVQFAVHHFVLLALKGWILLTNAVKHTDRTVKKSLTQVLSKNGHLPKGGKPSEFLAKVTGRKNEVATAIEKEASEEK